MDGRVQRVEAEFVGADEKDVATDPEHRDDADGGQERHDLGHEVDEETAELLALAALDEAEADVVHLHDECHEAVDEHRDEDGYHGQNDRARDERLIGDRLQGDDHDLAGEDEVGAHGPAHDLVLVDLLGGNVLVLALHGTLVPVLAAVLEGVDDLLRALETQVRTAEHEQDRHCDREELREHQRNREDEEQLVA